MQFFYPLSTFTQVLPDLPSPVLVGTGLVAIICRDVLAGFLRFLASNAIIRELFQWRQWLDKIRRFHRHPCQWRQRRQLCCCCGDGFMMLYFQHDITGEVIYPRALNDDWHVVRNLPFLPALPHSYAVVVRFPEECEFRDNKHFNLKKRVCKFPSDSPATLRCRPPPVSCRWHRVINCRVQTNPVGWDFNCRTIPPPSPAPFPWSDAVDFANMLKSAGKDPKIKGRAGHAPVCQSVHIGCERRRNGLACHPRKNEDISTQGACRSFGMH